MVDNLTVLNSTGGTFTLRMKDVGSGVLANMSLPTDLGGNTMVSSGATFTSTAQSASVVVISSLSAPHTVVLSSNPTVIPSSAVQVTLTSNTVTLSSAATVTPSSNFTVILSSNPTVTSISSGTVVISNGSNLANVVAGSSAVTSTMSALVVALSTLGNFSVTTSSQIQITNGTNTANVLAGSSTITSTMAALVVAISSNGAGVIATGTPTLPSSQYLSVVAVGDLGVGGANSSASNPIAMGGIYNSSFPTSVSSGQRVQQWFDKSGKTIVNSALRTLKGVQTTAISCSVTETNITPASSGGLFLDIYGLILANQSSANTQTVTVKDSSGGTVRAVLQVPANDTRGFMLTADSAMVQAASSQAWTATLSNSSGPFQVTTFYVTNA